MATKTNGFDFVLYQKQPRKQAALVSFAYLHKKTDQSSFQFGFRLTGKWTVTTRKIAFKYLGKKKNLRTFSFCFAHRNEQSISAMKNHFARMWPMESKKCHIYKQWTRHSNANRPTRTHHRHTQTQVYLFNMTGKESVGPTTVLSTVCKHNK